MLIGVLALQGGFSKHVAMLQSLNVPVIEVRTVEELQKCDGLIIPGGESTTLSRSIEYGNLHEALVTFFQKKPVFGTCAGIILMSTHIIGSAVTHFNALDIDVERNAFGRQAESFSTSIPFQKKEVPAVFIRAPRIRRTGPEVKILSSYKDEPILVQQGHFLGATFHPELTSNTAIHEYFLTFFK